MNKEVQARIANLEQKGWTLINIARELGLKAVTIESWKSGSRSPSNLQLVMNKLIELEKKKRIPPKKFYGKGIRKQEVLP